MVSNGGNILDAYGYVNVVSPWCVVDAFRLLPAPTYSPSLLNTITGYI